MVYKLQEERDRAAGIVPTPTNCSNLSDSDSKDSTGNVVRKKKVSSSGPVSEMKLFVLKIIN